MTVIGRKIQKNSGIVRNLGISGDKVKKGAKSIREILGLPALALFSASVAYFLIQTYLFPDVVIWAREILTLAVSLLVLAAVYAVSERGKYKIGWSVVLFLFAIFIWQMVSGYSGSKEFSFTEDKSREEIAEKRGHTEKIMFLGPGKHEINLFPGEPSNIIVIRPSSQRAGGRYTIKSPSYNHQILFTDGETIYNSPNAIFTWRSEPRFRLLSPVNEDVMIIVR